MDDIKYKVIAPYIIHKDSEGVFWPGPKHCSSYENCYFPGGLEEDSWQPRDMQGKDVDLPGNPLTLRLG